MAVNLQTDVTEATQETLELVESVDVKDSHGKRVKRLAVCRDSSNVLVLTRERERGVKGKDGKRSQDNGVERDWVRTSRLADVRDALVSKLIAF